MAGVIPAKSFSWLVKEKLPLFGISLVDAAVTMIAQHVGPPQRWSYSLSVRLENAIVSYVRYVGKAFWPANLSLYYVHPGNSLHWWQVGGAFVVLLAITVFAVVRRRQRYLLVGWLWFLGTLVPMIGAQLSRRTVRNTRSKVYCRAAPAANFAIADAQFRLPSRLGSSCVPSPSLPYWSREKPLRFKETERFATKRGASCALRRRPTPAIRAWRAAFADRPPPCHRRRRQRGRCRRSESASQPARTSRPRC